MDPISKFTRIPLSTNIPEEPTTEGTPAEAPNVSSAGIANIADSFVVEDQAKTAFSNIQMEALKVAPPETPPTPPSETVDAASVFEFFGPQVSADRVRSESVIDLQPNIDWDTISFLTEESGKANPDQAAMFQALWNLSPLDRRATMEQLSKQGTPPSSDLDKMIQAMYGKGGTAKSQEMGEFLATLLRDTKNDPQMKPIFSHVMFNVLNPGPGKDPGYVGDDTIVTMMKSIWNEGPHELLKNASPQDLHAMELLLIYGDRYTPDEMFYNSQIRFARFQKAGYTNASQMSDEGYRDDINKLLTDAMNKGEPDPEVANAIMTPWGFGKLIELSKSAPDQLSKLANIIQGSTKGAQQMGQLLANLSLQVTSPPDSNSTGTPQDFTEVMRQTLSALQTMQKNGDKTADDSIRGFVSGFGNRAVTELSKLSPNLLIQMQLILKNGDDAANTEAKSIVDQAYNIAKAL